jgi:hypothetical protein
MAQSQRWPASQGALGTRSAQPARPARATYERAARDTKAIEEACTENPSKARQRVHSTALRALVEPYGSTGVLAIKDGSPAQRSTTNLDRIVRDAAGLSRSIDRVAGLTFPRETFEQLRGAGLLLAPMPPELGGAGLGTQPGATGPLLQILTLIGAADLAVDRIYEGHCNALQLITAASDF